MEKKFVETGSFEGYKESCLKYLFHKIESYYGSLTKINIDKIEKDQEKINSYHNIKFLQDLETSQIQILDDKEIDTTYAEEMVLNGDFFWEHAAAGEATRLGLGTKYTIDLSKFSVEKINGMVNSETGKEYQLNEMMEMMGGNPKNLLSMSLGTRHMMQMSFDVSRLAEKNGKNPSECLKKQKCLIILNELTYEQIIKEFFKYNFFGMDPMNVFFMIQKTFNGIGIKDGELVFIEGDNKRLHNHGQMVMQKCHKKSIFRFVEQTQNFVDPEQFASILKECRDMVSYNIEDIDYLTGSIDLPSLALSLNLGKKGYGMVMEIVSQNPIRPQKGGAAFFDPILKKNVMIESNRLMGIKYENIKHLNKNFNHYPNPSNSYNRIKKSGLPLSFEVKKVKDGKKYLYPCPVQGDINFLVKTAFVMRKELKPINNWKSAATTPPTIKAMFAQDNQPGFKDFVDSFL